MQRSTFERVAFAFAKLGTAQIASVATRLLRADLPRFNDVEIWDSFEIAKKLSHGDAEPKTTHDIEVRLDFGDGNVSLFYVPFEKSEDDAFPRVLAFESEFLK